MNKILAETARRAITDDNFVSRPGRCQQFARTVVVAALGSEWGEKIRAQTAAKAAHKLLDAGLAFRYHGEPLHVGDLLYKTVGSGGAGHVGILGPDGKVYENSSVHSNGRHGAKGIRSLREYGRFQIVARLPEPQPFVPAADLPKPAPPKPRPEDMRLVIVPTTPEGKQPFILIDSSRLENKSFRAQAPEIAAAVYETRGEVDVMDFLQELGIEPYKHLPQWEEARYQLYIGQQKK